MPLDYQPREVRCPVTGFRWMARSKGEALLRFAWPAIMVGAFVVGMLLTPPDVFSQTLLAIPMYCLFEVGVFFSRFYVGKGRRADDEDDTSDKTTEE